MGFAASDVPRAAREKSPYREAVEIVSPVGLVEKDEIYYNIELSEYNRIYIYIYINSIDRI